MQKLCATFLFNPAGEASDRGAWVFMMACPAPGSATGQDGDDNDDGSSRGNLPSAGSAACWQRFPAQAAALFHSVFASAINGQSASIRLLRLVAVFSASVCMQLLVCS